MQRLRLGFLSKINIPVLSYWVVHADFSQVSTVTNFSEDRTYC